MFFDRWSLILHSQFVPPVPWRLCHQYVYFNVWST
jgi:hypothetical protein